MSEIKWRIVVTLAVILACSVSYFVGKKQGAMDAKLTENQNAIHVQDSVVRSHQAIADTARKHEEILTAYRSHVRDRIKVVHDTIEVEPDSTDPEDLQQVVIENPQIAQLITADDSTITALKNFIVVQDTLLADKTKQIALRDERIKLLESDRNPGKLRKIISATRWIAIGAVVGVAFSHR